MFGSMPQENAKAQVQKQIDENLKRVYQDLLSAEVPDRFTDLLAKLRQKDQHDPKSGGE